MCPLRSDLLQRRELLGLRNEKKKKNRSTISTV